MNAVAAFADSNALPTRRPVRLRCDALAVRRGRRNILNDITLEILPGESVCLIGPNGAGKTSLLLTMLGLLPPGAGRVLWDDAPVTRLSARERGREASYVPQFIDSLPAFTVREIVASARYPHLALLAALTQADERIVERAIADCGLTHIAERPITQISGGERQRALLAAAIAQDAPLLFLDEPLAALDPGAQIDVIGLLHRLAEQGRTLILSAHDLTMAGAAARRIIALRDGRAVADGPAAAILTPARLSAIYDAPFELLENRAGRTFAVPRWWDESKTQSA